MVTPSQDLVFGREDDKKAILQYLFDESISVIAIWGIEGIGKTTLARLVCADDEVRRKFGQVWWAPISKTNDKEEITGRIFESVTGKNRLDVGDLGSGIGRAIARSGNFLLVLDDVGDWRDFDWMSLLSYGAEGSRMILTASSSSFATNAGANDKYKAHELGGLSENSSWKLFKNLALTREKQNDPKWRYLGREIVKKCGNIPSVIEEMASTLSSRSNEAYGRQFVSSELFEVEASEDPSVMTCITLMLNYKALPSRVKDCFAYCFLFPKNFFFGKDEIVQLWIAQWYEPNEALDPLEDVGNAYFMQLLRGFFEEEPDGSRFRINPMIHDLLKHVNTKEIERLTAHTVQYSGKIRHLAIEYGTDDSRQSLPLLPNSTQLQSLLVLKPTSIDSSIFAQRITIFKSLHALGLRGMVKLELPDSIKELEQLRYLDISHNQLKALPDSITELKELLTLDISGCVYIKKLPNGFNNLAKLRNFCNRGCLSLTHFPPGFERLFSSLQSLSYFKVEEASQIGMWVGPKLKGDLTIEFDVDVKGWVEPELTSESSEPPTELSVLRVQHYPGETIDLSPFCNLVDLRLDYFKRIRHLTPLRLLCFLKNLALFSMDELEYIEEEEGGEVGTAKAGASTATSFPCLDRLELSYLPKLNGWSKEGGEDDSNHSFPVLSFLKIQNCPVLLSMPASPHLQTLEVEMINKELIQLLVPQLSMSSSFTNIPSSSLSGLTIVYCYWLKGFQGEALTSLKHLEIIDCIELKYLKLPPADRNLLEGLTIESCPNLVLWEEVEWDFLINLRTLKVDEVPNGTPPPSFVKLKDRGVQVLELW